MLYSLVVKPRPRSSAPPRVYPSAIVSKGARVGRGTVIGAFVFVADGATIGAACRIQSHTSVWAGVTLGQDVFVGPSVVFTNVRRPRTAYIRGPKWDKTVVERGASLGAGCVLVAPVRIGAFAMVGAGAVVTRNVPAHAVVVGNPARIIAWACNCGERLGKKSGAPPARSTCRACDRSFVTKGATLVEARSHRGDSRPSPGRRSARRDRTRSGAPRSP
jgi:UDP-2-acetamido-3-amino-2,3-dideoxy-glucuronate N-acetyltransferase